MAANAASLRSGVLGGYRRLLRLRKKVFHGDVVALVESKKELRTQIEINRDVRDSREICKWYIIMSLIAAHYYLIYVLRIDHFRTESNCGPDWSSNGHGVSSTCSGADPWHGRRGGNAGSKHRAGQAERQRELRYGTHLHI
jgi:hypothetical protein